MASLGMGCWPGNSAGSLAVSSLATANQPEVRKYAHHRGKGIRNQAISVSIVKDLSRPRYILLSLERHMGVKSDLRKPVLPFHVLQNPFGGALVTGQVEAFVLSLRQEGQQRASVDGGHKHVLGRPTTGFALKLRRRCDLYVRLAARAEDSFSP